MTTLSTPPTTLFFDVNETLLDMSGIKSAIADALNGNDNLVPAWFSQLLHHSLVDSATGQYHDFADIGAASLVMVAHSMGKGYSMEEAKSIITGPMTNLPAYDDVADGLTRLKNANFTLVAFSNSAEAGLHKQLHQAGIARLFDTILSVSTLKRYKPHPETYQWAVDTMQTDTHNSMMVAAHGWDVSGAKAAGMRTAFIDRPGKMPYPLGLSHDLQVTDITMLADKLQA
ncbi:haloacid dehalogenase type II [Salinimonas chungwhensis]|uniref:haloacid dehalogenase type II n=1 Tax=Salinimonas chungwhensis TaxID=265425 RepID=UPI00037C1349|nr:haloacid dehalogenase type II [Salinimonas chungwhensis]